MPTFDTIAQLKHEFMSGSLTQLPGTVVIEGHEYKFRTNNEVSLDIPSSKLYAIYENDESERVLVLVWEHQNLSITPCTCDFVSGTQLLEHILYEGDDRTIIGVEFKVRLPELFDDKEFEGKIDTGAEQCSLHADSIEVKGDTVFFTIEGTKFSTAIAAAIEIQTADNGADDRPVIELDVVCEQAGEYKDVQFNLNDRSDMPHKLLIGKNFLEQGNFLIDPLDNEKKAMEALDIIFKDKSVVTEQSDVDELKNDKPVSD